MAQAHVDMVKKMQIVGGGGENADDVIQRKITIKLSDHVSVFENFEQDSERNKIRGDFGAVVLGNVLLKGWVR